VRSFGPAQALNVGLPKDSGLFALEQWLHLLQRGRLSGIAEKHFAFAVSSGILQIALALAFALFVAHVLLLRAALYAAKRELGRQDPQEFFAEFDGISGNLRRNAIVGHPWMTFTGAVKRSNGVVHTVTADQMARILAGAQPAEMSSITPQAECCQCGVPLRIDARPTTRPAMPG
jgi:hypothetical protein